MLYLLELLFFFFLLTSVYRGFHIFVPSWVNNVIINFDNAGTNENQWVFVLLAVLVYLGRFSSIVVAYMIVGHTKVRYTLYNIN